MSCLIEGLNWTQLLHNALFGACSHSCNLQDNLSTNNTDIVKPHHCELQVLTHGRDKALKFAFYSYNRNRVSFLVSIATKYLIKCLVRIECQNCASVATLGIELHFCYPMLNCPYYRILHPGRSHYDPPWKITLECTFGFKSSIVVYSLGVI